VSAALIPGAWFFFWCKTLFPSMLLHPTHWIWFTVAVRIILQTLVSLVVSVPGILAALWLVSKILSPGELRYFNEQWNHD
jgi:hypothetical protein